MANIKSPKGMEKSKGGRKGEEEEGTPLKSAQSNDYGYDHFCDCRKSSGQMIENWMP
jgi:hypothetical protein